MDRRIILLLPLVLIVSIFPSQIIPNGHAGGYTGTGLVCITYPATANNCSNSKATIGPVTVGSSFTVGVFINNSAPMGGFDIYVAVNASYLNPTNAVLGPLIATPTQTSICIDGSSVAGSCTGLTANGPGVVEVSTVESSGANECGNVPPCSGLAFSITYNVVGTTAVTPIFYPVGGAGCSTSSVTSPTDVCVLVGDATGTTLPENTQGATVTQTVTTNPTNAAVSCASPVTVGMSTSCTATVTDTASTGATNPTGQVTLLTSGSGAFTPSKCTLSPVSSNRASCSSSYTPTAVISGTHNIGASYPGDTVHTSSTSAASPVTVLPAGPSLSTIITINSSGQPVNSSRGVTTGTLVHDSALLFGGYPVTGVSGTVTYTEYANGACAAPGSFISRVNVGTANNVPISASVTLSSPGIYSLQAIYSGDAGNLPLVNCASVTVGTTTNNVVCSPSLLAVAALTTCVVTITDITPNPSTPSGTVSFTTNSTATFTPTNSCALAAGTTTGIATCSITYTPTAIGHHTITGTYGGDSSHSWSTNSVSPAVTIRTLTTRISCSPNSETVGTSTTCTVTVTDTSLSPIIPTGTVTLATNSSGTFSTSSCTLAAGTSGSASCSVSYTPSAIGNGSHKITTTYSGDSSHLSSSNTYQLTVNSAPASPNISLSPPIFYSIMAVIVALAALLGYLVLGRRRPASTTPAPVLPTQP